MKNIMNTMNTVVVAVITTIMMLTANNSFAQNNVSRKALRLYEEARTFFTHNNLKAAVEKLDGCLAIDSTFIKARLLKADVLYAVGDICGAAAVNFATASLDSIYARYYFNAGRQFHKCGNYQDAIISLTAFLENIPTTHRNFHIADSLLNVCKIAQNYVLNAYEISDIYHDTLINTRDDEFVNAISNDEHSMYFTRRRVVDGILNEDILLAYRKDISGFQFNVIQEVKNLITLDGNEAAVSLSPDGNMIFFTACGRSDSYGGCDIYFSKKIGDGKWSVPKNLEKNVNSEYWDSQPSMSADSRILFFASNRPGGYGKSDIWYSQIDDDGNFSKARNCGNLVNTPFEENSPYIHFDGQTLYFSSDKCCGLGELDLYMIDIYAGDSAVNLGYPINNQQSQMNFVVSPDGQRCYISQYSDSALYDIISFQMPEHLRPLPVVCGSGIVVDAKTGAGIPHATIDITDYNNGDSLMHSNSVLADSLLNRYTSTNYEGLFTICLPQNQHYGITISAHGYMIYSDLNFDVNSSDTVVYQLIPIEVGERIIVRNVEFEYDSYDLREESMTELKIVARMMIENADKRFEIRGHTDNVGSEQYNDKLSDMRAKTVYDYLIKSGVPSQQLQYQGYGAMIPISDNSLEEGRKANRRTEIMCVE